MFNQKFYVSPYYSPTNILFAHPLIKGYISDKDLISMEIKMLDLEILDFNLNDLEKEVEEHLISRKNSDERYRNQDINIALQSSLKPLIASNLRHNMIIDKTSKLPFYDKILNETSEEHMDEKDKRYILINMIIAKIIQGKLNKKMIGLFTNMNLNDDISLNLKEKMINVIDLTDKFKGYFKETLINVLGKTDKYIFDHKFNDIDKKNYIDEVIFSNGVLLKCINQNKELNTNFYNLNNELIQHVEEMVIDDESQKILTEINFYKLLLNKELEIMYSKFVRLYPSDEIGHTQRNINQINRALKSTPQTIKSSTNKKLTDFFAKNDDLTR